mmetsp:Transcript_21591/g.69529  ORF Transcript_21591/g.69529 Transcript_21591/m.69529 type:complete len:231 (+) Transcript_21591:415-1107(+)
MARETRELRGVAFVKKPRKRRAKESSTGSSMVTSRASSSLSTEEFCRSLMVPFPMSPLTSKEMPSLVTAIEQESPRTAMSRTMRWNSDDDIFVVDWYSCSGMPRCSPSMSINFNANSDVRSCPGDSNAIVSSSPSSCALRVTLSSFPAHFKIFAKFTRFSPRVIALSHRKWPKRCVFIWSDTSDTWLESIACTVRPLSLISMFASVTKSLIASMIFFSNDAFSSCASNIL